MGMVPNLQKPLKKQQKWTSQYEGPYLIICMLSSLTVEIQKSPRLPPKIVHIDKPKPCRNPTSKSWLSCRSNPNSLRTPVGDQHTPRTPIRATGGSTRPPCGRLTENSPRSKKSSSSHTVPVGNKVGEEAETGIGSPTQSYRDTPGRITIHHTIAPRRCSSQDVQPDRLGDRPDIRTTPLKHNSSQVEGEDACN